MSYSVLLYPNITLARKLAADSYIIVVGEMIEALNQARDDLEFTALLPEHVESLDFPNVRQVVYPLPTYPNQMRAHFDTKEFLRAIDWKSRSYDIVWSHLPEHTQQIKNLLYNSTNERPAFVSYCHWFEVPELVTFADTLLLQNLCGILSTDTCGVNSQWLKDLVLGHASEWFNADQLEALNDIMEPQLLGHVEHEGPTREPEPGLIVYNHRHSTYTGFPKVLKALDKLWERRQDFQVMFTLEDVDRPYAVAAEIDQSNYRNSYLEQLSRAWAALPRFNCQWAVSVVDCFSVGVPVVLPNDGCFPEMVDSDYALLYEDNMVATLERALDEPNVRQTASQQVQGYAQRLAWSERIKPISKMFDRAIASLPVSKPTESMERALTLARQGLYKQQLLKELGWGVRIPWTQYRNRLRLEGIAVNSEWYQPADEPDRQQPALFS